MNDKNFENIIDEILVEIDAEEKAYQENPNRRAIMNYFNAKIETYRNYNKESLMCIQCDGEKIKIYVTDGDSYKSDVDFLESIGIYYSIMPVMVIPRKLLGSEDDFMIFGDEDDCKIWFNFAKRRYLGFERAYNKHWAREMVDTLSKVKGVKNEL